MQKIPTSAVPMLTAIIPREDTAVLDIRVIMEMERIVNQVSWQIEKFRESDESVMLLQKCCFVHKRICLFDVLEPWLHA